MKLIAAAFAALFLAVLGLSVPAPMFTTKASANRMDGRATCGQMVCMQDRYYAAKRREAKTKNPNEHLEATSVGGLYSIVLLLEFLHGAQPMDIGFDLIR